MSAEDVVHRPVGDLLEEILKRGAPTVPTYLSYLSGAPERYRIAVLLGVLGLGPEVLEVVREHLRRRDSAEKWALAQGLGELGHPEAEGYFALILRERSMGDRVVDAVRALGNIAGARSLPAIITSLEEPQLFPHACQALQKYGTAEAIAALERKIMELPAFQALADLGVATARDAFLVGLQQDPEWAVEAARGIGNLGDPDLATVLLPLLQSKKAVIQRAAFEAYAKLGAPEGVEPLLDIARGGAQEWMIEALAGLDHGEVHHFLVDQLDEAAPKGLFRRLFARSRSRNPPSVNSVCRALRNATETDILVRMARLLEDSEDPAAVRSLLSNRALVDAECAGEAMLHLWRSENLLLAHAGAVALLQRPSATFLSEALDLLQRPGLIRLDTAGAAADPEHLLRVYASDNNPALMIGEFVDSGLLDLGHLYEALRSRVAAWSFPSDSKPEERFGRVHDVDVGAFLTAVAAAQPAIKDSLIRLWDLLAQLEARGDSLLDLFLSHGGEHRGGLQRCLCIGMPSAVAKFIEGKLDRDIPELDRIFEHVPREGALVKPMRELFERARQALKAECRDMALISESHVQGDLVLIEKL